MGKEVYCITQCYTAGFMIKFLNFSICFLFSLFNFFYFLGVVQEQRVDAKGQGTEWDQDT